MSLLLGDAPQELIDLLNRRTAASPRMRAYPPHGHGATYSASQIQDMLSCLDPDMAYDDWLKVGMALHAGGYDVHLWEEWSACGQKYMAGECQSKWQGFSPSNGVSLGTLVYMAKRAGYAPQATPAPYKQPYSPQKPALSVIPWSDLHRLPKRRYLIKGVLDEGAFSVVYGASNSGKTFFALNMACHIALGWQWSGRKIKKGSVIYVAGEGGLGISERLEAFRKHHELEGFGDIYILPQALILSEGISALDSFLGIVADIPEKKLIIIDTLARSMGEGDENSASDMGKFVQSCDHLRAMTGAHIMVIHHTGKDETKGARGSSALKAAIDTEIYIRQENGIISGLFDKQRDAKKGNSVNYEIREHEVGKDEDGDPVMSCALEETTVDDKKPRLNGQTKQGYQVLCNLMLEKGIPHIPKKGMPEKTVVRVDDFKECFIKAGIAATDKPDSLDKAFHRAKAKLKNGGYIGEWDGYIWLTDKPDKAGQTENG